MFRTGFLLIILTICVQFSGCFLGNQLENNRAVWRKNKIENYDFELQRSAEGIGGDWSYTFKVRQGEPQPVLKESNLDYPPSYQYKAINTVEKLFDYIEQQSIDKKNNVIVEYDNTYGFPKIIKVEGKNINAWTWEFLKIKRLEIIK